MESSRNLLKIDIQEENEKGRVSFHATIVCNKNCSRVGLLIILYLKHIYNVIFHLVFGFFVVTNGVPCTSFKTIHVLVI